MVTAHGLEKPTALQSEVCNPGLRASEGEKSMAIVLSSAGLFEDLVWHWEPQWARARFSSLFWPTQAL